MAVLRSWYNKTSMKPQKEGITVITGQRGIGKSTICRQVAALLRNGGYECGGSISYKDNSGGIIIEDVETEESMPLASRQWIYTGPRVGSYCFNPEGFEYGLRALKKGLLKDVCFIDELGHLEARGEGFAAVIDWLEPGVQARTIAVIREELLDGMLPKFKITPEVITVDEQNRDSLAERIVLMITGGDRSWH